MRWWQDCHDGNILRIGGLYWNFCMAYGSCHNVGCASDNCGGRLDHNISIYRSPNLAGGSWTYVADLLPYATRLSATYYRPKVVFNPRSKEYVFWVNVLPRSSWSAPVNFAKSSCETLRTHPLRGLCPQLSSADPAACAVRKTWSPRRSGRRGLTSRRSRTRRRSTARAATSPYSSTTMTPGT